MKKNGFTLVELLSVIVVLAVLILFATPAVTSIYDKSSRRSFKAEAISFVKDFEKAYIKKSHAGIGTSVEKSKVAKVVHNFGDGDKNYYYLCMELSDLVGESFTQKNVSKYKGYIETYVAVNSTARYTFVNMKDGNYEITGSYDEISSDNYKVLNTSSDESKFHCFGKIDGDPGEEGEVIAEDTTMISGPEFNEIIKGIMRKYTTDASLHQGGITRFDAYASEPKEEDNPILVSTSDSKYPVYIWFDPTEKGVFENGQSLSNGGTLRMYSKADKINLNQNSSRMFANWNAMHFRWSDNSFTRFDTSKVTDMSYMFYDNSYAKTIDLSSFDTSKVENMSHMFEGCTFTENINTSSFNTSSVKNMNNMFRGAQYITNLNLSNFDTSSVEDMSYMFHSMLKLTSLNISSFRTHNVKDMSWMFDNDSMMTELDLSHFDTSNVEKMGAMFQFMSRLERLNISSFNTSNNTNMYCMFRGTKALKSIDLSHFDTSSVTTMQSMFDQSGVEELDLSSFNTSKAKNMYDMFYDMPNIRTIYVGDNWTTDAVEYKSYGMFKNNSNLVGGSGTRASGQSSSSMARVDCPTRRGYFTYKGPKGDTAAYCGGEKR